MEIYWNGAEITDMVRISKCVYRDASFGRCDSLEIEFENAEAWHGWKPETDDRVTVRHDCVTTGEMYLNTVLPEEERYRVFATSLPCAARAQAWESFTGRTVEEIVRAAAMGSGMDYRLYGIDGDAVIPYAQRERESRAAFLSRLLLWRGAVLKCVSGRMTAIGIEWAQAQRAGQVLELAATQEGVSYTRGGRQFRTLTVLTPSARATAVDLSAPDGAMSVTVTGVPAATLIQAGVTARALLLTENRKRETLTVRSEFNRGFAAMTRADVESETEAAGAWLIDEAEHDFVNLKSTATMRRCVVTIQ